MIFSIIRKLSLIPMLALLVASCEPAIDADQSLQQQVSDAITSASDLPRDRLVISVTDGVVHVSGTLDCGECGGMRTPGGSGTVQQSLGAVIRAVPGVRQVNFSQLSVR